MNLNEFLKLWIHSFRKRQEFKILLGQMVTHLSKCPIENNLKGMKMRKISKMYRDIDSLSNVSLVSHNFAIIWLSFRWRKRVMENGFIDIDSTFRYLDLQKPTFEDSSNNKFTNSYVFNKYFKNTILPINCQISRHEFKNNAISISQVRPSLPQLVGKLYGLCVEYEQNTYSLRIFGIVDPDHMKIYRNNISKDVIIKDLYDKYKITKEESLPFLDCLSYRDYLIYEPRQIVNKIKQQKEKIEYYKKADLSSLFGEYHFLPEYMRIELVSHLIKFSLKTQARYLMTRIPVELKYLDWDIQKEIDFDLSSPRKLEDSVTEQVPYEIRISSMKTSESNKAKAFVNQAKIFEPEPGVVYSWGN